MDKKNSKEKCWSCFHGCEKSDKPCKHLERLLDNPNKGTLSFQFMNENKESVQSTPDFKTLNDGSLEAKLATLGLTHWEIEIILDRFISNLSFEDIALNHGYQNRKSISRVLTNSLNKLKQNPLTVALLMNKESDFDES